MVYLVITTLPHFKAGDTAPTFYMTRIKIVIKLTTGQSNLT